jgi:hypothetical protein
MRNAPENTPEEASDPETQRAGLVRQINEVIGDSSPILTEVLSYFPEEAQLFIRTQEHAQQVEGKKEGGIIYCVKHKERGFGFDKKEMYQAGWVEHLHVHGFTGEYLIKLTGEVRELRGGEDAGHHPYSPREANIDAILSAADKPAEKCERQKLMVKKMLEIMNVTPEEIQLMKNVRSTLHQADKWEEEARELEARASLAREKMGQDVEQMYPRLMSIAEFPGKGG